MDRRQKVLKDGRRIIRLGIVLVLLFCALPLVISPGLAERLVFFPSREDPGPAPLLAGVAGEDVTLVTPDGTRVHGWWHEVAGAPAVLLLHGNAGTIAGRAPLSAGYLRRGLSVFMLDYRGYGRSGGRPTERGVYEDARTALDWVADRAGGPRRLVIHGRSLGGVIAARIAGEGAPAGLILESSFTSLDRIARAAYPFLPAFAVRRLRGHFDALALMPHLRMPILVIHGTNDGLVPVEMGRALHSAAGAGAEWFEVEGAGHNDLAQVGGAEYLDRLAEFVVEVTGG